jgi:UDP-N-acetylmuramoyl-tripeptide--D-alanyl-D-alanine ligase
LSPKELLQQKIGFSFRNVVVDSRLAGPGDLYIALPGARVDGHDFVQQSYEKGCACALVTRQMPVPIPQIVVSDVVIFLQEVVAEYIQKNNPRIIAITGSVGKTTTKEFLRQILATTYHVAATPGNANSQVGLPMAIFNYFSGEEDFWVVEMGMTHPGQLTQLCLMAPPELALITQIALVHAANFESLEEIASAKAELLLHPKTVRGFINSKAPCQEILKSAGTCRKIVVSDESTITQYPDAPLGKHLYQNLAMAIEVALYLGVAQDKIDAVIPALEMVSNRMARIEMSGVTILNDSYNAAEISTKAALDTIPQKVNGLKIAVIGQMMELGKFSDQAHKSVAKHALDRVDQMVCFGEACKPIFELWTDAGRPVFWTNDRSELLKHLNDTLSVGDFLLLKGSRSNLLWELIPDLRIKEVEEK